MFSVITLSSLPVYAQVVAPPLSTDELEYLHSLEEQWEGEMVEEHTPAAKDWSLDITTTVSAPVNNTPNADIANENITFSKRPLLTFEDKYTLNDLGTGVSALTDSTSPHDNYIDLQYQSPFVGAPEWQWRLQVSKQSPGDETAVDHSVSRYRESVSSYETGIVWDATPSSPHSTALEAGVEWQRIQVDYNDIKQKQDLIKPFLALYYRHIQQDHDRIVNGGLRLEKNLSAVTGATTRAYERLGRPGVDKDYSILSADLGVLWRHQPSSLSSFRLWGRTSLGESLLTQEQSGLGGVNSIRGYPDGQVLVDSYYAASLEHRWVLESGPSALDKWALSIFAEGGWFERNAAGAVYQPRGVGQAYQAAPNDGELASVGLSSHWTFNHNLELTLDYGVALKQFKERRQAVDSNTGEFSSILARPENHGQNREVNEGDSEVNLRLKMRF